MVLARGLLLPLGIKYEKSIPIIWYLMPKPKEKNFRLPFIADS